MAKILISYRRADAAAIAGRILDRLVARYGEGSVFIDVDNIPFGTDFREQIKSNLLASDVVLAIVGPRWLGIRDHAPSRISEDNDPIRVEIEAAINQNIPIIPILVDGAAMPQTSDLPVSIAKFSFLNAAPLDAGREFHHQMDRLIRSIDRIATRAAALPPDDAQPQTTASPAPPKTVSDAEKIPPATAGAAPSGLPRAGWIAGAGAAAVVGALLLAWPYLKPSQIPASKEVVVVTPTEPRDAAVPTPSKEDSSKTPKSTELQKPATSQQETSATPTPTSASASGFLGEWLVKDQSSRIAIASCGNKLWGVVSWEREPSKDANNPDPSKRSRPIVGLPLLIGMQATKVNLWEGKIYNPQDGKMYDARMSLSTPNTLRIEACVIGLCGGEQWTKFISGSGSAAKANNPVSDICGSIGRIDRP